MLELKNFVTALENIDGLLLRVIEAMNATILKQQDNSSQTNFYSPASKQMSAVLGEGEQLRKYKGKTIKRRPDGRYWTRYYDQAGKQHSVYGRTINECLENLKQALQELNQSTTSFRAITLGEWLQKWLELYKIGKLKKSTLEQMQRYLRDVQPLASKKLNSLTH